MGSIEGNAQIRHKTSSVLRCPDRALWAERIVSATVALAQNWRDIWINLHIVHWFMVWEKLDFDEDTIGIMMLSEAGSPLLWTRLYTPLILGNFASNAPKRKRKIVSRLNLTFPSFPWQMWKSITDNQDCLVISPSQKGLPSMVTPIYFWGHCRPLSETWTTNPLEGSELVNRETLVTGQNIRLVMGP